MAWSPETTWGGGVSAAVAERDAVHEVHLAHLRHFIARNALVVEPRLETLSQAPARGRPEPAAREAARHCRGQHPAPGSYTNERDS